MLLFTWPHQILCQLLKKRDHYLLIGDRVFVNDRIQMDFHPTEKLVPKDLQNREINQNVTFINV